MRKYHHLGIPTTEKREGEVHLKHLKIYVSGYKESPYHIEWMRYEPDAPYPELVKTMPHVAFQVDDVEQELQGKKVIIEPNSPSPGVTVAFIEDNGAPVHFPSSITIQADFTPRLPQRRLLVRKAMTLYLNFSESASKHMKISSSAASKTPQAPNQSLDPTAGRCEVRVLVL
jgi:hypothetical protein